MSDANHPGTFDRPVSSLLARVLGEAASSAFAPENFYVVCRYDPDPNPTDITPFDVHPPCATYEDAQSLVAELRHRHPDVEYGIFGPFVGGPQPEGKITVGSITVHPQRGEEQLPPIKIGGDKYDALFYSEEAVRKFVVPYYAHVAGPEYAVAVLDAFKEARFALMGHLPWSEEVDILAGPGSSPPPATRKKAGDVNATATPLEKPAHGARTRETRGAPPRSGPAE
jgi:hypothetical protein